MSHSALAECSEAESSVSYPRQKKKGRFPSRARGQSSDEEEGSDEQKEAGPLSSTERGGVHRPTHSSLLPTMVSQKMS